MSPLPFFKSAVAGAILEGSSFPWQDNKIKHKIRWRLLTVGMGTDYYEARAVKIGDWTGAREAVKEFFRQVKQLIEVEVAIGSLLYQDSAVAVFSFPGERFKDKDPGEQKEQPLASWLNGWEKWIQGKADEIAEELKLETPPLVRLSNNPTRSLVPMVREIQKVRDELAIPVHRAWNISWSVPGAMQGHECPVCRVRPNGDPTNKNKPCEVCRDRRHHRLDAWLSGRLDNDTLWVDEVADTNGRVAFLTFSLDLEPWLEGKRTDSLRTQAIPEWRRFNPILEGSQPNPIDLQKPYDCLWNHVKDKLLGKFNNKDPVLKSLQAGYEDESGWKSFFEKIVEDRTDAPSYDSLNNGKRADWIVHQLFCKLPSLGRVYRFWRQTEAFFQDLLKEFRQLASRNENRWRVQRLVLTRGQGSDKDWRNRELYDGHLDDAPLSLVFLQELQGFITACNLSRLLKPSDSSGTLKGRDILLEAEDVFGQPKRLIVGEAREIPVSYGHLGIYNPLIPLELTPLRFRVLVPLEVASECLDHAIAHWQEEFARVWDRLPLRVGVITFYRTMPFQVVIEAVQNLEIGLEEDSQDNKAWQVLEKEAREGVASLLLARPDGERVLKTVPVHMPDGRGDVFYPYAEVEDHQVRFPLDFRHPHGQVYRYIQDLQLGDGIKVYPSWMATAFLHSAGQRFEPWQRHYLEDWKRMREVWKLLKRIAPSEQALHQLRNEVSRLREQWRVPEGGEFPTILWRDTIRALLATYLNASGSALEALTEASANGLLEWAMDWHKVALKQSVAGGET